MRQEGTWTSGPHTSLDDGIRPGSHAARGFPCVKYQSILRISTPLLNIKAAPILNMYLGNTRYTANKWLMDVLKSS